MEWKAVRGRKRCNYKVTDPKKLPPPFVTITLLCGAPARWQSSLADGPREWSPRLYAYRCDKHHHQEIILDLQLQKLLGEMLETKMVVMPYIPLQTPVRPSLETDEQRGQTVRERLNELLGLK